MRRELRSTQYENERATSKVFYGRGAYAALQPQKCAEMLAVCGGGVWIELPFLLQNRQRFIFRI